MEYLLQQIDAKDKIISEMKDDSLKMEEKMVKI